MMSMDIIGKKEMGEKARREVTYDVIGYEEASTLSWIRHHASCITTGGGKWRRTD
jgi:hypothetical protein